MNVFDSIIVVENAITSASFVVYMPICLCVFVSKILTRILTTRLGLLLPKLISYEQSGFVVEWDIQNNVILSMEQVNLLDMKYVGSNVVIKLDMKKPFDKVLLPFLWVLLYLYKFDVRFINLVMDNLAATRLSIWLMVLSMVTSNQLVG